MTMTADTITEITPTVKPTRKPATKRVRKAKPAAVKVGLPGIGAVVGGGHLAAADVVTVDHAASIVTARQVPSTDVAAVTPTAAVAGIGGFITAAIGGGWYLDNANVLTIKHYPAANATATVIQVQTRYFSAENFKGARVGARILTGPLKGRRLTSGYDYAAKDAHASAVKSLMAKLDIVGTVEPVRDVRSGMVFTITA